MIDVVVQILGIFIFLLQAAIIIRAILSFLPLVGVYLDPSNPVVRIVNTVTDPILNPLRRYTTFGMMDLSPLVALLLLDFLRNILNSMV